MKRNDWLQLLSEVNTTCKKARTELKSRTTSRKETTLFTTAKQGKHLIPFSYKATPPARHIPMFLVTVPKK